MRLLYLIGSVIVFLLILTLALPQVGATCNWYLIKTNLNPTFVLFPAAGLGAVLGGLLVLRWKVPKEGSEMEDDEEGGEEGGKPEA